MSVGRGVALVLVVCAACSADEGPPPLPTIAEVPVAEDMNPDPHILEINLRASETTVEMMQYYQTKVWAYNDRIPGPLLEARVGDRVIVHFQNDLAEPTTIHWHGLRISPDMDGNPMEQPPVEPGASFTYDFTLPDAGTFWFHPHMDTIEQIDRGMYGAILVEEPEAVAPKFTAERLFVLDDIRLDGSYQIPSYSHTGGHDVMMGRLGNQLLTNGKIDPATATAKFGSVERWRLVNAATARVLELTLDGVSWRVIASDGGLLPQPYTTDRLVMAPGQRFDVEVVYDKLSAQAQLLAHVTTLINNVETDMAMPMVQITLDPEDIHAPLPVYPKVELPAIPDAPIEKAIALGASDQGFTINGQVAGSVPVDEYTQGVPVRFTITNEIGPYHPFHLHGQFFQILTRNDKPANEPGLKDTVLLDSFEKVQILTYLENPGMWMYHCHIPEHAENGMMAELMVNPAP
ncbi:MAG TPA: multicopper oxidase family protein [Kofleriaceae bacterium]|nr:multicopper oxidase family protein [Kofleriaceae bacterium]